MTLYSALRSRADMEVVGLNFSSSTSPGLLLKSLEQHCEYSKTMNGTVLSPRAVGLWLVVFCDEINLPQADTYGTQRVISFLRQLVEYNGFWRPSDKMWVAIDRIQFVGACQASLLQIYGTLSGAMLKATQMLRGFSEPLTQAMVQVYIQSQRRFTTTVQPHYVYSPRELTRWVKGIYEAIRPREDLKLKVLLRIWAHEAHRFVPRSSCRSG
ncbi:hypothetical protein MRB53_038231 [Persea americana]|nr:hypothetical protein MRB53_038231 [Persea americana]